MSSPNPDSPEEASEAQAEPTPSPDDSAPFTEDPRKQTGRGLLLIVVLLVALALIGGGIYLALTRGDGSAKPPTREQAKEMAEVSALFQETQQRQKERLESGDTTGLGVQAEEDLEKISRRMVQAQEAFTGEEAKVFEATNKFLEQTRTQLADYNKTVARLEESGLVRAETLPTREDLAERRDLVQKFRDVNRDFREFQMNAPQIYRDLLEEQDLDPTVLQQAMQGYLSTYEPKKKHLQSIRQSDEAFAVLLLRTLDLLEENWGQWEYVESEQSVVFDDPGAAEKYQEGLEKLERVAAIQMELQKQLLATPATLPADQPNAPVTGFTPQENPAGTDSGE